MSWSKFRKFKSTLFFSLILSGGLFVGVCVPPSQEGGVSSEAIQSARLDSLRRVRCPRLLSSAAEYYKNRDWNSAVRIYKELMDLGCDKGYEQNIYPFWAIAYENLGKFDSSEYVLLQALKRLPEDISLRKRLAYAYRRLGTRQKEIEELNRIIDRDSSDVGSMFRLSELYDELEKYNEEIYILEKILKIDPSNLEAQARLARVYKKLGIDPIDIYRKRFEDHPTNVTFGLDYADQLFTAGRYPEWIKVLEQISQQTGSGHFSHVLVLSKLADAYQRNGQPKESAQLYEKLASQDPKDMRIALNLIDLYIELAEFENALSWAETAIKNSPQKGEAYGKKGMIYYKSFQECRQEYPTADDKIVAFLAHQYFSNAEENNYLAYARNRKWLEENEVIFDKGDWFMLGTERKSLPEIYSYRECYQWIKEGIKKQADW